MLTPAQGYSPQNPDCLKLCRTHNAISSTTTNLQGQKDFEREPID